MPKATPEERFWNQVVQIPDGCWIWIGTIASGEYGQMVVNGRTLMAHRFAYELLVGPIPEGLTLDHLCRETMCCRPDHLEPVTLADNIRRQIRTRSTHCPRGHPYDEANTRLKRQRYQTVDGEASCMGRICRACQATGRSERNRDYYLRNRDRLIAYQRAYNARQRAGKA